MSAWIMRFAPPWRLTAHGPLVTLRRPRLANRLELQDLEALGQHVTTLAGLQSIQVVVLRAEGPHFCSGFHIDAVPGVDAPALFEALCDRWEALPAVTLAVLQGGVWGGATDLALACDFRLGSANCQMAIPAARLGLHYYGGGMRRLVSRMGLGRREKAALGRATLDAQAMWRANFLDEVLKDGADLERGGSGLGERNRRLGTPGPAGHEAASESSGRHATGPRGTGRRPKALRGLR